MFETTPRGACEAPPALRQAAGSPVPLPASGNTAGRFDLLAGWAAADLSLGRLAEGHHDAAAILAELGAPRPPGAVYGVWAARSRSTPLRATRDGRGWRLDGSKAFCSGAETIDRALVTADAPDGYRLFDVDLSDGGVGVVDGSWPAVGMADSGSATVRFVDVAAVEVGGPGSYLDRPGFWWGGAGVAACWWGGARGLVDHLLCDVTADSADVLLADVGRAVAEIRGLRAVLDETARAIDTDPLDLTGRARSRTLAVREAVHAGCRRVLGLVADAGGARPLGQDRAQSRRAADLYVYLSQHHGGPDAVGLARAALEGDPWS